MITKENEYFSFSFAQRNKNDLKRCEMIISQSTLPLLIHTKWQHARYFHRLLSSISLKFARAKQWRHIRTVWLSIFNSIFSFMLCTRASKPKPKDYNNNKRIAIALCESKFSLVLRQITAWAIQSKTHSSHEMKFSLFRLRNSMNEWTPFEIH